PARPTPPGRDVRHDDLPPRTRGRIPVLQPARPDRRRPADPLGPAMARRCLRPAVVQDLAPSVGAGQDRRGWPEGTKTGDSVAKVVARPLPGGAFWARLLSEGAACVPSIESWPCLSRSAS